MASWDWSRGMSKGCIEKKHEETCRGNGNVKYLDRGDGFTTSAYLKKIKFDT